MCAVAPFGSPGRPRTLQRGCSGAFPGKVTSSEQGPMSISQMPSPATGILCVLVLEVSGRKGGRQAPGTFTPKMRGRNHGGKDAEISVGVNSVTLAAQIGHVVEKDTSLATVLDRGTVVWTSRFASIHSCWLSITSGAVWAFVAPALCIIVVSPCLWEQRGWALWALRPHPQPVTAPPTPACDAGL